MPLRPRTAAWVGYVCGIVFFAFDYSWLGETAGALLGPFAFILDIGPALLEGLAFAVTAAVVAWAAQNLRIGWVPVLAAAAFTVAEWLRSSGVFGFPMYQIGTPFIETPLAPLAAFAGIYGLTFAIACLAAGFAVFLLERNRNSALVLAACVIGVVLVTSGAWLAWPARIVGPATTRVAAVQANITQSLKWEPEALLLAVNRYTSMTAPLAAFKPQIVVWPETVITTLRGLNAEPALEARFASLAAHVGAMLVVGSIERSDDRVYNDLFFFDRTGALVHTYRKRQLVPFAEYLPGPRALRSLPFGNLPADFGIGTEQTVVPPLGIAPLICWESAFSDLAQVQAANGARIFVISTDDAWFGASDGPYVHAQIASLRAVETGRWIVRAGATGISGVIAPDGTWRSRGGLQTQEVITGTVGDPQPTAYSRFGPHPVGVAFTLLAAIGCFAGRRRSA